MIRVSHPHSITKEQQHERKPQPVYLSILHNSERKSFPQQGTEFILIRRDWWQSGSTQCQDCHWAPKGCPNVLAIWRYSFCCLYTNSVILACFRKASCCTAVSFWLFDFLVFYMFKSHQESNLLIERAVFICRYNLKIDSEALELAFRTDWKPAETLRKELTPWQRFT